jgi:hypothetical protein
MSEYVELSVRHRQLFGTSVPYREAGDEVALVAAVAAARQELEVRGQGGGTMPFDWTDDLVQVDWHELAALYRVAPLG